MWQFWGIFWHLANVVQESGTFGSLGVQAEFRSHRCAQVGDLAATLVHEVNHVFNNSEEKYRSQKAILVEEYRAFYSEELLRTGKTPTATRAKALKEEIIAEYGLKNVTAKDVPDVPPGVMVPPR